MLTSLPGVLEAVVLGKPSPAEQGESVRAVIACREGALFYHDVVLWCRPRLAAYKIPRSIILLREIPRTERGKLDRQSLLSL